jgi:predicted component of type VI protein secretion system
VVWDPATQTATIRNFADPTQRKNPIRVQDRAMLVGEMRPLQDGDRIQIGDIILRFHAAGGESIV